MRGPLVLAVLGAAALACQELPEGPSPERVVPSVGRRDMATAVSIRGRGFFVVPRANFDDPQASGSSSTFAARLGPHRLTAVTWVGPGELTAVVPAGLPAASYDLVVTDPRGREGFLPRAFSVTSELDAGPDARDRDAGADARHDAGIDRALADTPADRPLADAPIADTRPADTRAPDTRPPDGPPADLAAPDQSRDMVPHLEQRAEAVCPTTPWRCSGASLEHCVAGVWSLDRVCPAGCDAAGARCFEVLPSNGVSSSALGTGLSPLSPTSDVLLDTTTGTISGGFTGTVVTSQGALYSCGASSMRWTLFAFTQISIPAGVTVRIRGSRAAVIVAAGPISIAGRIELAGGRTACSAATPDCAGPGGYAGGQGLATNPTAGGGPAGGGGGYSQNACSNDETGGGGGGGGGAGGAGGNETDPPFHPGGAGGIAFGTSSLEPLCGGSGGGGGGGGCNTPPPSSRGGGGGGALQLVSGTSVSISCTNGACGINAGGGGGEADHVSTFDDGGGGGGGGGGILIEAPTVSLAPLAILAAGGGGGGGGLNGGLNCKDGADAPFSAARAAGGTGTVAGGAGGGGAVAGGDAGGAAGDATAGGGGGAGRIRINALTLDLKGQLSPASSTGLFTTGALKLY
jgi:hypothetical protein